MKILSNRGTIPSSKLLRDALVKITGERILVTIRPENIKDFNYIRYGNSSPVDLESTESDTLYNSAHFIALASSKYRFSRLMLDNDIYSPVYYSTEKPENFPVVLRSSLSLSGGKGISVANNIEEFNELFTRWWTPYIYTKFELRVHILGGAIVKIFKKILNDDIEDNKTVIRNNNCCHFSLRNLGKYSKLVETVGKLESIEGFDGKFYSLDIGWDSKKKDYFVFEANSASGLNENTAELYAEYLTKELGL